MSEINNIECPYCLHEMENCDCPDLFYDDIDNTEELNNQYKLLKELQILGYNIVTCGHCGNVFITKSAVYNFKQALENIAYSEKITLTESFKQKFIKEIMGK